MTVDGRVSGGHRLGLQCGACGQFFGPGVDSESLRVHTATHQPAGPDIGLVLSCERPDGGQDLQPLDATETGALLAALAGVLFPTSRTRRRSR